MLRIAPLLFVLAIGCSESEGAGPPEPAGGSSGPSATEIAKADQNQMMEMQKEVITEVSGILEKVKDVDTAKVAAPLLEQIAQRIEPMKKRLAELMKAGGAAKDPMDLAKGAMGMLGNAEVLGEHLERLKGIPGVSEILEKPMERIMQLFDASKG